ncbi:uncharacterized protein LOC114366561 [Ostrinia furnacalis]|uniref:uncharacterized protein LOC114366561 n=1 Tax=Ostrinia furnacalis TaxID=93504 RepID=UPI00103ABC0A|nr:uncharacterized protein LOC114366561 [Ostrinia furnacalis]
MGHSQLVLDESNKQADIETVKLSDTSDNEAENESMLKKLLGNDEKEAAKEEFVDKTEQKNEEPSGSDMNIVELEESSSEDDIQEVKKASKSEKSTLITVDGLNITIPGCVEVSNVKVAHTPNVEKEAVIQGTDDKTSAEKPKPKFSLEIFSLDSDEEDSGGAERNGPEKCFE